MGWFLAACYGTFALRKLIRSRGGAPGRSRLSAAYTWGNGFFSNDHECRIFIQVDGVACGLQVRGSSEFLWRFPLPASARRSSPAINPTSADAATMAPGNTVPCFIITAMGLVREARFIRNSERQSDGGVAHLFTIAATGADRAKRVVAIQHRTLRTLATQRDLPDAYADVRGAVLIEAITEKRPSRTILASDPGRLKANNGIKATSTPWQRCTVTRWLAGAEQSLLIFSGEAYNCEMGAPMNFQN